LKARKGYQSVDYNPFESTTAGKQIKLTESQKEVWYSTLLGNDANCAYNECIGLHLHGELKIELFKEAFSKTVKRHQSLRSCIEKDGQYMEVFEHVSFEVIEKDFSKSGVTELESRIKKYIEEIVLIPFDLSQLPLFSATLIKCSDTHHLFIFKIHHIICDGWSLGVILKDISRFYNQEDLSLSSELFSTYAEELNKFNETSEYRKTEDYWIQQYKELVPLINLPIDFQRGKIRSFKSTRYDIELPDHLYETLKTMSAKHQVSFVNTLLAVFEIFIHKISRHEQIVTGVPNAGQAESGMYELVGHCVNLLPLKAEIDQNINFSTYLAQRKQYLLDAYENQKLTFGSLLKKIPVERDSARIPLIPVVFNVDMGLDQGVKFNGLEHLLVSNPRKCENFELFLNVTGSENKIILEFSYNISLFQAETIKRWSEEFIELIENICNKPESAIKDLNIITVSEKKLLDEWSGFRKITPVSTNVVKCFDKIVSKFPDKNALIYQNERIKYSQLDQISNKISNYLLSTGIKQGSHIAVCLHSSPEFIYSVLAILKSACCFIPIDPEIPEERIRFILEESNVNIIIKESYWHPSFLQDISFLEFNIDETEKFENLPSDRTHIAIKPDTAAYIMYTSGSVGEPKGVCVPHKAIVRLCKNSNFIEYSDKLRFLQLSNVGFDASTFEIWGSLLNGAELVLMPYIRPTLSQIAEVITENKIDVLWLTSGLFTLMVDSESNSLKSLKYLLSGGDVLSVPHVIQAMGILGPGKIINGYGPTENTTFTTTYKLFDMTGIKRSVPIGQPVSNTYVYILDDNLKHVPIGIEGQLYTGGEGLALRYHNKEALSKEKFIKDPYDVSGKSIIYKTGDIVRWNNSGEIEFIGRDDNQIKIRGFRVEINEIERVIRDYKGIKECAVIVKGDNAINKNLVAYVVYRSEVFNNNDLLSYLESLLPDYMIPSQFISVDKLALNEQGKIDRNDLLNIKTEIKDSNVDYFAPISETEKFISSIWQNVLLRENISVNSNFFKIGGHSLAAIQILAEIEKKYSISLPLSVFFEHTTISSLAKVVSSKAGSITQQSLVTINDNGNKIPLFVVHGAGLHVFLFNTLRTKMSADQPIYALQARNQNNKKSIFNIEETASFYITEIMKVHPTGPYALSGYSLGGYIALEMTKQLQTMGKKVVFLGMFDTDAYIHKRYFVPENSKKNKLIKLNATHRLNQAIFYFKGFCKNPSSFLTQKWRTMIQKIKNKLLFGKLPDNNQEDDLMKYNPLVEYLNMNALKNYYLSSFNADLDIFKATEKQYYIEDFEYYGWKNYVKGNIRIYDIPGSHSDMFNPPNVDVFAKLLQKRLDEINSNVKPE